MAIIVKYTNKDDSGILKSEFTSSEQAGQYIQDSFCNDVDGHLAKDILQLVEIDADRNEHVWAEYIREDFDC